MMVASFDSPGKCRLWARRWFTFDKGGGYRKWDGLVGLVVDWQKGGARINETPGPRVQGDTYFFREGWTYSQRLVVAWA